MDEKKLKAVEQSLISKNYTLGCKILHYKDVSSTMSIAKDFGIDNCANGTVIIADTQTGGCGRSGKIWAAPEGGIWLSIVLFPSMPPYEIPLITLAAGAAVCKTIETLYGLTPGLKWPNDVLINGKKVCGILTEGSINSAAVDYAILGIGVNLNFKTPALPEELKGIASTMLVESGLFIEPEKFLHQLLLELNLMYTKLNNNKSYVINIWRKFSVTIGKEITAVYKNQTIQGTAKDITPSGSLIIQLKSGQQIEVCSGEVSLVRAKL